MRKVIVLLAVLVFGFLTSVLVSFHPVNAQESTAENSNNGIIKSPISNFNYTTNLLLLKIAFPTVFSYNSEHFGSDEYYFITYSIDGGENVRIPKEYISYEISYGVLIPNNLTATVALPPLNDGYHTLTVNAREPYIVPGQSGYFYRQETVEFTVSTTPPTISISSIKNKTFTSSDVPLTLFIDKPHVGLCYSLDEQSNITISGNTTLTGLQNGEHAIEVYAGFRVYNASRAYFEDIGYVGGYQTDWISTRTFFSVNAPTPSAAPSLSPSPTQQPTTQPTLEPTQTATPTSDNVPKENFTPIILATVVVIAVTAGVLVYFRKRKRS